MSKLGQPTQRVQIQIPGRHLWAELYRSPHRPGGVVAVVRDGERIVFETTAYDKANGVDAIEWWLAANTPPPPTLLAKFVNGWEPPAGGPGASSKERVYYEAWAAQQRRAMPPVEQETGGEG